MNRTGTRSRSGSNGRSRGRVETTAALASSDRDGPIGQAGCVVERQHGGGPTRSIEAPRREAIRRARERVLHRRDVQVFFERGSMFAVVVCVNSSGDAQLYDHCKRLATLVAGT